MLWGLNKLLFSVIFWLFITIESSYTWHQSNFFVNSKLPQQCGDLKRYNPEYNFEYWGAWPWMGLLTYTGVGSHRCNAILIHPEVALTSMFCLRHAPEVPLKDVCFIAFSLPGLPSYQNISITAIDSIEKRYNSNDLSILKLEKPVIISSLVHPICLWEDFPNWDQQLHRHIGLMIGSDLDNIYTINELRVYQAPVRIISLAECQETNDKLYNKNQNLTRKYGICFRYIREPKKCHSVGSPMILPRLAEDGSIVWYLRGLMVYRTWYCDEPDRIENQIDIGSNRNWIESHFKSSVESGCGRRVVSHTALITRGTNTLRGDWPWHAAIFIKNTSGKQRSYICGGSLISPSIILTAGHCTVTLGGKRPADSFSILLGKHALSSDEPGSQTVSISEVIVHENFDLPSLLNDIALLKLATKVTYSEYVQPGCLWDEIDKDKESVVNRVGTVIGWGFTEEGNLSDVMKSAVIPIVEDIVCYQSNTNFYSRFVHNKTFCAGNPRGNGTNVCNGDSGGSFLLPNTQPDQKVTWFIRGIVSVAVPKSGLTVCDPDYYVVYTDVAQYKDWINSKIL